MFDHLLSNIRSDLANLRCVVETHEKLRDLISESLLPGVVSKQREDFVSIAKSAPSRSAWLVHDHCAAVTRLYAIFENFIESLVGEYLEILPTIYLAYSELPLRVRTQHRIGVALILQKLGREGLYKDLLESKVIEGLAAGHSSRSYSLFGKAFLVDPQNYRADIVNSIFGYLNFSDVWAGVEAHPEVIEFMESRDPNETPRVLLKKLVEDRNLASHTSSSSTWSVSEIKAVAYFLEAIADALIQITLKAIVSRKSEIGQLELIGTVVHRFKASIVGVKASGSSIAVGDTLFVSQPHGAFTVRVQSIQLGAAPTLP